MTEKQGQGEWVGARDSGVVEITEFEIAGVYCNTIQIKCQIEPVTIAYKQAYVWRSHVSGKGYENQLARSPCERTFSPARA